MTGTLPSPADKNEGLATQKENVSPDEDHSEPISSRHHAILIGYITAVGTVLAAVASVLTALLHR